MFSHRSKVAIALATAFAAPMAFAETVETVVVTATRFQSAGNEQPIAAQVITADEIAESSATTVSEVLSKLGGVHTRINFSGVPDSPIDLRGFGMTGDQNTLVLINGQRISENESTTARISAIPVGSIKRIEILRGAGAVLYGGGATAGTINIITKSPSEPGLGGSVSVLTGSHGLRDMRGALQYADGMLGLSLSAQRYENDNYRDNNRAVQDAVNGEVSLRNGDDFIALSFNADEQKARLPGARTEAQLKSDPRGTSMPNDYADSDQQIYALRGEKRFGEITLAMDIGHRKKDSEFLADSRSGADFDTTLTTSNIAVTSISPRVLWSTKVFGIDNKLTVGGDWSDWDYERLAINNGSFFGFPYGSTRDEKGAQKNQAVYLRDEMQFATGTRVSVGARREKVEQTYEDAGFPVAKKSDSRKLSASEFAVQQDLVGGASVYGRIGRSFRVANVDENRCFGAPCRPFLEPQKSKEKEVGVQWKGRGADARVSFFDIDLNDELHFNPFTFSTTNLPPTRRRGFEIEGRWAIGKDFELGGRYARTRATFREGSIAGFDVRGNAVPLVPNERIGLDAGWQVAEATRIGLNVSYVGEQRYDNDQRNRFRKMPSYTVTDLKLSHDYDKWRFTGGINNLFEEEYYSYGIVNGAATSFNAYPEDPRRTTYVSAEYRF